MDEMTPAAVGPYRLAEEVEFQRGYPVQSRMGTWTRGVVVRRDEAIPVDRTGTIGERHTSTTIDVAEVLQDGTLIWSGVWRFSDGDAAALRRLRPCPEAPADLRDRVAELESALLEYIAASDAPASSANRGEMSVWQARVKEAERAIRQVVGVAVPFPWSSGTGVSERAEQLEVEVLELRGKLDLAMQEIYGMTAAGSGRQ